MQLVHLGIVALADEAAFLKGYGGLVHYRAFEQQTDILHHVELIAYVSYRLPGRLAGGDKRIEQIDDRRQF